MKKPFGIVFLALLSSNISFAEKRSIFCSYSHGDHTLVIKENEAIENNSGGLTILYQSVAYKNNIYILKSSPNSGAGKKEKRTWVIDLGNASGSLFIERAEANYGPYNDYKCIEKSKIDKKIQKPLDGKSPDEILTPEEIKKVMEVIKLME